MQQRLGFTAVYVTHDQEEALAVSDRIVVMKDGRIAQEGTPKDLYEAPASEFIADFIGEANVVDCTVEAVSDGSATIRVGGLRQTVPAQSARPGAAKLAIRANAIAVAPGDGPLTGRIASSAYLGDHVEYEIDTGLGRLFAVDAASDRAVPPGTEVSLAFRDRGLALISGD